MASNNTTVPNNHISIVGAPFCGGQPKGGVELGPAGLRETGIVSAVTQLGWKVVHDEDVTIIPRIKSTVNKLKDPHWVGAVTKDICDYVYERVKGGEMCVNLGGDHSIATGTIAAALKARPDICIVWVDAHADINTPDTTDSGNLHGMPVAFLAKIVGEVEGFEWLKNVPTLRPDQIAYIGLRDVDEGEKKLLKDLGITHFWAHDVARRGITAVMDEIVAFTANRPIHISFDIDALDPNYAPATGTPVRDGITLDDGTHICERLAATGRVVSMDLVEVNPSLSDKDGAGKTHDSSVQLIKAALQRRRT